MRGKIIRRGFRAICVALALLLCALTLSACEFDNTAPRSGKLVLTALDVGQGDSILITCEGESMLVDAGIRDVKQKVIAAVQDAGGVKMIFATHPHSDHIGAMAEVIRACPPELFVMPEKTHTSASYRKMIEALEDLNIETRYADAGQKYTLGGADITVLSPERGRDYGNVNDFSIVLLIEYQGRKILLTGDAGRDAEELFAESAGDVDILKVGHHGSFSSTSEMLLSHILPEYAVISCATDNEYGYPHKEPLAALEKYGAEVYRTDENGAVTFTIEGGEISVSCER